MGAIVSIARRKFEEYPIFRKLCLIFFSKNKIDNMIKDNPKTRDEALNYTYIVHQECCPNGREVSESIVSALNQIMTALTQPRIIVLGVYGSNDARKCMVVEKITRRVKRDNLFDVVVIASVMKKPDFKRIQGQLGDELGLQLHEKSLERRARRLRNRIKMEEKILIILHNVWGGINLGKIGIPFGNDHKGCKILLFSESQQVLSDQMNTQIEISL